MRDRSQYFNSQHSTMQPAVTTNELNEFHRSVETIEQQIEKLFEMLPALERVHLRALEAKSDSRSHQELEKRNKNATNEITKIRDDIKGLEAYVIELRTPNDKRIAKSQQQKIQKRFLDFITRYQNLEFDYREKYKNQVERQLKIVHPNASDNEITQMIETDSSSNLFNSVQSKKFGDTKAALDEVEQRHQDLMKIEKNVIELHQLFTEMTLMIQQQGEVIDDIETHVSNTVNYTEQANQEIDKAIEHRRSTRKKLWCCFFLGIILVIVIIIIVLVFAFPQVLQNAGIMPKPETKAQ